MSMQDLVKADPQLRSKIAASFQPGKFRGVLSSVAKIHINLEREREQISRQQEKLEEQITKQLGNHKTVQKALAAQVSVANRGYANLLQEHEGVLVSQNELKQQLDAQRQAHVQELTELGKAQRVEKMEFRKKIEGLERQVAGQETEISTLKSSVSCYEREISELKSTWEGRMEAQEHTLHDVSKDSKRWMEMLTEERENAKQAECAAEEERKKRVAELKRKAEEIQKSNKQIDELKIQVGDLKMEYDVLRNQAQKEELNLESRLEEAVEVKEAGYQNLVDDFMRMQKKNHEEISTMREQFERMIKDLEIDLKKSFDDAKKQGLYLEQQLAIKQDAVEDLKVTLKYLQEKTDNEHNRLVRELASTTKERDVLNDSRKQLQEILKQKEEEGVQEDDMVEKQVRAEQLKIMRLENAIDSLMTQSKELLAARDVELNSQLAMNAKLQKQLVLEGHEMDERERKWEERLREKDLSFEEIRGDIRFVEQQMERERQICDGLRGEIKGKQQQFVALDKAYRIRLAARMHVEDELKEENKSLEEQLAAAIQKQDEIRQHYESLLEDARKELQKMKEEREADIAELQDTIAKKKAEWEETMKQLISAREEMEEVERTSESKIKELSRSLSALQSEMNFAAELAEEKYQRLVQIYEKLQAKYDAEVSQEGLRELKENALAMEREISELNTMIMHLNATVKGLHDEIVEKDFEISETQRETADLLFVKETAYRDMCAQIPPLEKAIEDAKKQAAEDMVAKMAETLLLRKSFALKLKKKDEVIESMRFNDRGDLLAQISQWEKKYREEKGLAVTKELEYRKLMDKQREGTQVIMDENTALREEVGRHKKALVDRVAVVAKETTMLQGKHDMEVKDKVKRIDELMGEIVCLESRFKEELDAASKEPAYVQEFRETIVTLDIEIASTRRAHEIMIAENTRLTARVSEVEADAERMKEKSERQADAAEDRANMMNLKFEEIKKLMSAELLTAEAACRDMEYQLRNMPNIMQDEIAELRGNLTEITVLWDASKEENAQLSAELKEERIAAQITKQELEEKLALASSVLTEVASLQSIKSLTDVELFLGVDLDGDGKIG
eukprot:GEMP01002864.1.p1 GENE.GEMP01002864.1~~GEMP01002864.1.p1  ORF type:complete len:1083 (+),score=369.18 GEMP01002864.1:265-3513(+)